MSAILTLPLPADHWLFKDGFNEPPMLMLPMTHKEHAERIRIAARYAIRASTANGTEPDFDPDAMVQNFIVGMLGYWPSPSPTEEK